MLEVPSHAHIRTESLILYKCAHYIHAVQREFESTDDSSRILDLLCYGPSARSRMSATNYLLMHLTAANVQKRTRLRIYEYYRGYGALAGG